jgi:hypothetical protein
MNRLRTSLKDGVEPPTFRPYSINKLLLTMAALALAYVLLLAYMHYVSEADVRRIFGGAAGIAVMQHAERVEAYRIGKISENVHWQNAMLSDYPVLKGPVLVSQSDSENLRRTLQDRNSYRWNAKGCAIVPGVRFDFVRGNDRLSVLVCFECDMTQNFLNGKSVGGGDFEGVRSTLVRLARTVLPDEAAIQSLSEKR